jgi:hypothetical protein
MAQRAAHTFPVGSIVTHWSSDERFKVEDSRPHYTNVTTIDGVDISYPTVDLTLAS